MHNLGVVSMLLYHTVYTCTPIKMNTFPKVIFQVDISKPYPVT